jgi:transposase
MPWTETIRRHYERCCPRYASDLTDDEWSLIEALMPSPKRLGRPRKMELREVVNALLYMASSGGAWRLLPRDFPPFSDRQAAQNRVIDAAMHHRARKLGGISLHARRCLAKFGKSVAEFVVDENPQLVLKLFDNQVPDPESVPSELMNTIAGFGRPESR